jgi:hypothetical protein
VNLRPLRRRSSSRRAPQEAPRLLDRAAAAEAAGVSERTISRAVSLWEASGGAYGLRCEVRRAKMLRVDVSALRDWIADGCPTACHAANVARAPA